MECKKIGIYIHIPFCRQKCPYCNFYSIPLDSQTADSYTEALHKEILSFENNRLIADSIYFGGGTPALLGIDRLYLIVKQITKSFSVDKNCEITIELNPASAESLGELYSIGFNRLSIGMQSAIDTELSALGRTHNFSDTEKIMESARSIGFDNISLDLMLGIPNQTSESLVVSLNSIGRLAPEHLSAYMLKIEPNTPFAKMKDSLNIADDDLLADLYLQTIEHLENIGYEHYEISNLAKNKKHSRHNRKYWQSDDYIGFGCSAHSCVGGKRFHNKENLQMYIRGENCRIEDGSSGGFNEYVMLRLRLRDGIKLPELEQLFGIPAGFYNKLEKLRKYELIHHDNNANAIRLTKKGCLLSNTVICELCS